MDSRKLSYDERRALVGKLRCTAGIHPNLNDDCRAMLNTAADELEAALAQQAQPECEHGETMPHDGRSITQPWCFGPGPQPEPLTDEKEPAADREMAHSREYVAGYTAGWNAALASRQPDTVSKDALRALRTRWKAHWEAKGVVFPPGAELIADLGDLIGDTHA